MSYQYDLFISYSRADREWAHHVYQTLIAAAPRPPIFFDYESLRAGDDWEEKIQSALEDCQNLLLFWSDQAADSHWVTRELWSFVSTAKPNKNPDRRIILVNLKGLNTATKGFQQISRPELQNAYELSVAPTSANWRQAIAEIRDGLTPKKPVDVPVVVLTLTLNEFQALPATQQQRVQTDLGRSEAFLRARYGVTRDEWKPYAGAEPIALILDRIQNEVNLSLPTHRIKWRQPEADFWEDTRAAQEFVNNDFNTGELSVLVVDPVAVYSLDILQRLLYFQDSLMSDRRVIVTLPPFGVPRRLQRLRETLANRASPYFNDYLQPTVPPRRRLAAQCAWNVTDGEDIKRHILAAAGSLGISPAGSTTAFLRQGQ